MNFIKDILNAVQTEYQFISLLLIVAVLMIKWFFVDKRKDSSVSKAIAQISSVVESQNQLLNILIRRYSDNLSTEQISPFINWVYQSFSFAVYHRFINTHSDIVKNRIAEEEAKKQLEMDISNLSNEMILLLGMFKYEGVEICEYFSDKVLKNISNLANVELRKSYDVERTLESFNRIARKAVIELVDKILKHENTSS